MKLLYLFAGALAAAVTTAAYAVEPWAAAQRGCVVDLEEKCAAIGGANCNGWWPQLATCTIRGTWGTSIPDAQIRSCINWVEAMRRQQRLCNACGNPVREVIHCSTGL